MKSKIGHERVLYCLSLFKIGHGYALYVFGLVDSDSNRSDEENLC